MDRLWHNGTAEEIKQIKDSITGQYLSGRKKIEVPKKRRKHLKTKVIEVNLFDFDKEIYDQQLKVFVKKYLREEVKFDGLEALVKQIDQDKIDSLTVL